MRVTRVTGVGTHLSVLDTETSGPSVLLLHGLGGCAQEWLPIIDRLTPTHRVVAFDQRGHGHSDTHPRGTGRAEHIEDVATVIHALGLAPVILVGQSMGAHTAMLTAARYPELVARLLLIEGGVGGEGHRATTDVVDWFRSWPVPFASRTSAAAFFGGGAPGMAWAAGLVETPAGLVPRFDVQVLHRALHDVHRRPYWESWQAVRCPIILVRADNGYLPSEEAHRMLRTNPNAELVELQHTGHDAHLERPEVVAELITGFHHP